MAGVFLSYDHEDSALARPLAQALEKAGHTVWFDRHIHGGAQYSRKIEQALDEADAVLVLWSPRSLESAWVRDEAAEGRDRNKLVPLSVENVSPPMGFRQFQTINLGAWKGRGRIPRLAEILEAVDSQAGVRPELAERYESAPATSRPRITIPGWRAAAAIAALLLLGAGAWLWFGRDGLPTVEVTAGNGSSRSQSAANDLYVKLGSLAQVGQGKWQLVDGASAPKKADFVFRTADLGTAQNPRANLVLLDGKDGSLLWSREFTFPAGGEPDLRQQLSFTAGRVLGCALESREAGGLRRDLLKLFLNTCATIAETSTDDPTTVTGPLRAIVTASPRFVPAWRRLLSADLNVIDLSGFNANDQSEAIRELRADVAKAKSIAPDLPELTLVEARSIPATDYAKRLELFTRGAERHEGDPQMLVEQSLALQRVGRMFDAVQVSHSAAQLDPLSPTMTTQFIMALAHSGQIEKAGQELARAEKLWAGTGALRDAMWAFHFRYGDPAIAIKYAPASDDNLVIYFNARTNPTPANVAKLVEVVRQFQAHSNRSDWGWGTQPLSEVGHVDEAFDWLSRTPTDALASDAYLLFRPGFSNLRRDPRFMQLAKRIGLVDYWHSSGHWPDFCAQPGLPYDCRTEAAKYAS